MNRMFADIPKNQIAGVRTIITIRLYNILYISFVNSRAFCQATKSSNFATLLMFTHLDTQN